MRYYRRKEKQFTENTECLKLTNKSAEKISWAKNFANKTIDHLDEKLKIVHFLTIHFLLFYYYISFALQNLLTL